MQISNYLLNNIQIRLFSFIVLLSTISCVNTPKSVEPSSNIDPDKALVAMLDTIWMTEQMPIRRRDSLGRVYGYESKEYQEQDSIYHKNHDINEVKIRKLLDTKGWPSIDVIGEQGNHTICNVIQHSHNDVRIQYLPLMRKAVKEKNLNARFLVRAEDRIATEAGQLQIYGGQIKYYPETKSFDVWPIKDPENVDKRRAALGLEPMAEFLKGRRHPLEWDLEAQIKRTEAFKKQMASKEE